jgi:hypothetical protein
VTVEIVRHPKKHCDRIVLTDEGMQIDESEPLSDRHPEKVEGSKDARWEPDSNVTAKRRQQPAKQPEPSFSTDEGMQIDEMEAHPENADSSIRESSEPDSNVTFERLVHLEKHAEPIVWRERGI